MRHRQCPWCRTWRAVRRHDEPPLHPMGRPHSREASGGAGPASENDSPARRSGRGRTVRWPAPVEPGVPPRSGGRSAPPRSARRRRRRQGSPCARATRRRSLQMLVADSLTSLIQFPIGERAALRLPFGDRGQPVSNPQGPLRGIGHPSRDTHLVLASRADHPRVNVPINRDGKLHCRSSARHAVRYYRGSMVSTRRTGRFTPGPCATSRRPSRVVRRGLLHGRRPPRLREGRRGGDAPAHARRQRRSARRDCSRRSW